MTACIEWAGYRDRHGYGQRGGGRLAHRFAYETSKGPIPEGLEIDHLCMNKLCVNPDHLEAVTRAENMRRRYSTQTQCSNGHLYAPENTYIKPTGHRDCRTCIRERARVYRAKSVAA